MKGCGRLRMGRKHRRKVRGRDGRRDKGREHAYIKEVREAARAQKNLKNWVEETEPEQEQEQEQEPPQIAERNRRRDHGNPIGPIHVSARGNRGHWAAATAEGTGTNTSDSEYLSANDSLQTVCTDSSRRTGTKGSTRGQSTDTKRTLSLIHI